MPPHVEPQPNIVPLPELVQKVLGIPHDDKHIFSVVFVKKNGELRKMVCRRGVRKYLRGGELPYNARSHQLLPVFDLTKMGYRMVTCESILELHYRGETFRTPDFQRALTNDWLRVPAPAK